MQVLPLIVGFGAKNTFFVVCMLTSMTASCPSVWFLLTLSSFFKPTNIALLKVWFVFKWLKENWKETLSLMQSHSCTEVKSE